MDPMECRIARLSELVEKSGGITEFVKKYRSDTADKPIDPSYVSQLINRHRSFGEKASKNMAIRAGLPINYFEQQTIREGNSSGAINLLDRRKKPKKIIQELIYAAEDLENASVQMLIDMAKSLGKLQTQKRKVKTGM